MPPRNQPGQDGQASQTPNQEAAPAQTHRIEIALGNQEVSVLGTARDADQLATMFSTLGTAKRVTG